MKDFLRLQRGLNYYTIVIFNKIYNEIFLY